MCAAFVALAGILTLSEYVLDLDLGLDQLLFKESSGAVRTSHLGRMSPVTAVNFGLVGCALLLLETTRGILPGQYLAIGAATRMIASNVMACTMPATGLRPPFLTFVAVRAIAPVAGIPPKSGVKIFATPWAISY